jgi:hypothetical protein
MKYLIKSVFFYNDSMSITSTKINHSSDSVLSIQILSYHHAIKEEEMEETKRRREGVKG